jgi:4'-phosphopantetheinyl transferase
MIENVWRPGTPEGTRLGSHEVHIWRAHLPSKSPSVDDPLSLSAEEQARAFRFAFAPDREDFIVARNILRQLLGSYLQIPPGEVPIETLEEGKPTLSLSAKLPRLRFNLSHSHGVALYAFSIDCELGIDVEKIRPEVASEGIENHFFSPRERAELAALSPELRQVGLFLCWTRKEAYIKAIGGALHTSLANVEVSLSPGRPPLLSSADQAKWTLYSLEPGKGYVGALVAEGRDHHLRYWDWQKFGDSAL